MVKYSEWISDAWNLFSKQALNWILLYLVFIIATGLISALGVGLGVAAVVAMLPDMLHKIMDIFIAINQNDAAAAEQILNSMGQTPEQIAEYTVKFIVAGTVGATMMLAVISLLIPPLIAGIYKTAFNQMRTGVARVSDLFSGFAVFWQSVLAAAVIGSLIALGLIFFIIPGIYVTVCSFFMWPLIVEKRMGYWAAYKASAEMVKKDFWNFFFFFLIICVMGVAGGSFFLISLVVMPMIYLMFAVAYRDVFGVEGVIPMQAAQPGQQQYQPPPPQGYAPPQQPYPPQQGYQQPPQGYPPQQQPPQPAPQPQQPQGAVVYCPNCGLPNATTAVFCNNCGTQIKK